MSVQEYLEKHKLSRRIEDAVNAAVRAKAPHPLIYISNHLKRAVPSTIIKLKARKIIDSRGNPTVEVDLYTNKGMFRAVAPSGAPTGVYEAVELHDGDENKYLGKGVLKAVTNINEKISLALVGMDPLMQAEIDKTMMDLDKTENKGELGVNAILAVSMAVCKAGAAEKEVPLYQHIADISGNSKFHLPVPAFNIINGGKHAGNELAFQLKDICDQLKAMEKPVDEQDLIALVLQNLPAPFDSFVESLHMIANTQELTFEKLSTLIMLKEWRQTHAASSTSLSMESAFMDRSKGKAKHWNTSSSTQELMILPIGASSFSEAMQMGCETYHHLKSVIKEKYGMDACNVGDEGGFAPNISRATEGLDLIMDAIERAGYTGRIKIGMDVAASEFCTDKKYDLNFKSPEISGRDIKTGQEMIEMYKQLCSDYPIVSIEDPFDQDDWENTKILTAAGVCQVVGDDLLVSNPKKISKAIKECTCNALLLKVNQIGTVTEAIEAVKMAKDAKWGVMASHRSGETENCFIADLAVGLSTGQIKTGAPCRSEQLAKYNQLLRIEEELCDKAIFVRENWRPS